MLAVSRGICVIVCLVILAGCGLLSETPVATKVEGCLLPAPLTPGNPQDDAVQRRFGAVCTRLGREPGLDFGEDTSTYSCRILHDSIDLRKTKEELERENEEKRRRLSESLGRRVDTQFELREKWMAFSFGQLQWAHDLLLLVDKDGRLVTVISMRSELDRALAVKSPNSAARLVLLSNALPFTEWRELCKNGAYQDGETWVFPSVSKYCKKIERDVRVGVNGRISFGPDRKIEEMSCPTFD